MAYIDLQQAEYAAALVAAGLPESHAAAFADSDRGFAADDLFDDSHTLSASIGRPTTTLSTLSRPRWPDPPVHGARTSRPELARARSARA